MDYEFDVYFNTLKKAESADAEIEALQQIARILATSDQLNISKETFDTFVENATTTENANVRLLSIKAIVGFFKVENVNEYLDEKLVNLSIKFVGDPNFMLSCLFILVATLGSENEQAISTAVQKGAIEVLFRSALTVSPNILNLTAQIRELCLTGLQSLSKSPKYALQLHEKDVWAIIAALNEDGYISPLMLLIVKNIVMNIGVEPKTTKGPTEPVKAEEQREKEMLESIQKTKSRISRRIGGNSLKAALEKLQDENDGETSNNTNKEKENDNAGNDDEFNFDTIEGEEENVEVSSKGYSEEEGLLSESALVEKDLSLACVVCLAIDRKGIMGLLVNVCQNRDQELLAEYALSILGLLSPIMHKIITRDNRIIIVRVLLNLIEFIADGRLVAVAYVLDTLLKQKASQNIVLQCGSAAKCAVTGARLLSRKDHTSQNIVQCLTQLLFHISQIENGATELSNAQCIGFLSKSMKNIEATRLHVNKQTGKERWSSSVEVISLLTLINVAIESPVMSGVSEANLHKALANAAKRGDELGLLAVLGSAFFVGKSTNRIRSREFPRVQPALASMMLNLLENSSKQEPSLGGIYWSTQELLQAIAFLVEAPHNQFNLRVLLPVMVQTLQDNMGKDPILVGLVVEILLTMSYNKHIMKEMVEHETLRDTLKDAATVIPFDTKRSAETLLTSLENEQLIRENLRPKSRRNQIKSTAANASGALVGAAANKLGRMSQRLSFRSSNGVSGGKAKAEEGGVLY